MVGGLDLDFEGALEGQKASILAGMDGWTYSTATYQVPAGCGGPCRQDPWVGSQAEG